jgi:alkylhydroperoxidase family enzyme
LTIETAPEASRPLLESVQKSLGFVPNLMATYANSPAVLQGYLSLDSAFRKSSFTRAEQQVILLTASVENDCDYCAAAHATVAGEGK